MSEQASVTHPAEHETSEVMNGNVEDEPTALEVGAEEEEESDDYDEDEEADYEEDKQIPGDEDVDEEEEGESEGENEEANGGKDTLTHLLLANPNAPVEGDDLGDEEEDEEDDDEYIYEQEPAPVNNAKKRSRDEVTDDEDTQDIKKAKA